MHANKREEIKEVYAGDIAAAVGLRATTTGDTLCDEDDAGHPRADGVPRAGHLTSRSSRRRRPTRTRWAWPSTASRWRTRPSASTPTRRPARPSSRGMGELHLEIIVDRMFREFKVEANVGKPQVAYRETITKQVESEGALHPADRRPRPVRPLLAAPHPAGAGQGLRVRERDRRRLDPEGVHQPDPEGHRGGHDGRRPRRLPDGRRQGRGLRRQLPRRRLVRDGVQDRRLDGLQGRRRQGAPGPPRADHGGRGGDARGLHGRRHRRPELAAAARSRR